MVSIGCRFLAWNTHVLTELLQGVTPAWYRYAAREQISHYSTVKMTNGTVTKIRAHDDDSYFTVKANLPGLEEVDWSARKIVLATGIRDEIPSTPGLSKYWGKGIYWCPWCDGHEHADQKLGLLAPLDDIPGQVREILTLDTDLVALVNGTDTPKNREALTQSDSGWQTYLDLHNVRIENRTIKEVKRLKDGTVKDADPSLPSVPQHDLFRIEFDEGPPIERNALFASFPSEQRSSLGQKLGVDLLGGKLKADFSKGMITNVVGVYAVGDANSDNSTNVPHALFSGKRSAVSIHGKSSISAVTLSVTRSTHADTSRVVALAKEDAAAEVAAAGKKSLRKRDVSRSPDEHDEKEVWKRMNGGPEDLLYAGEFER